MVQREIPSESYPVQRAADNRKGNRHGLVAAASPASQAALGQSGSTLNAVILEETVPDTLPPSDTSVPVGIELLSRGTDRMFTKA
jgi:hypothetical protein